MKRYAEILVERFDEGITARWLADNGEGIDKSLATTGNEASCIGKLIWNDVVDIFENETENCEECLKIKVLYELEGKTLLYK